MCVVEDDQVGDEMIVLDDLDLLIADVFPDDVIREVRPFGELVEQFTFIGGRLDELAKLDIG